MVETVRIGLTTPALSALCSTYWAMFPLAGTLGFAPRLIESKSIVLLLNDIPMSGLPIFKSCPAVMTFVALATVTWKLRCTSCLTCGVKSTLLKILFQHVIRDSYIRELSVLLYSSLLSDDLFNYHILFGTRDRIRTCRLLVLSEHCIPFQHSGICGTLTRNRTQILRLEGACPIRWTIRVLATPEGLEPSNFTVKGWWLYQFVYGAWSSWLELN